MQKIPLSMAQPHMKLAKEVLDKQGRVLCNPGETLEQGLIEKLQKLGVKYITVEDHPIHFPWDRPLEKELKLLEARFIKVKGDPRLQMLKEVIKSYWTASRREDE